MPNGGTIAVLGLAFKPETDDMRESPAITIIQKLLATNKFIIKAYDPEAMANAKQLLAENQIQWCLSTYEAIQEVEAILVVTEWSEFRNFDGEFLAGIMPGGKVFDFRHIFSRADIESSGLKYYGMGF